MRWAPERADAYVAALAANLDLVHQFEHAIEDKDHEKVWCLLRSLIVHAAGDAGMARLVCVCSRLHPARGAVRDPPWFDAHCQEMRRVFCEAVQSGQAVHACKLAKKQYRNAVRRSKWRHTKFLKAAFLDKLARNSPDLHAMLRQQPRMRHTPLIAPVWTTCKLILAHQT